MIHVAGAFAQGLAAATPVAVTPVDGQFVVRASVTIGYATLWRQVHAMLIEAARRAGALNPLHGNIQDVFNGCGVQIMSPHCMAGAPAPQVVPPVGWWPRPATAPAPASRDAAGRTDVR